MYSKNIVKTGKIFAALFDRIERGGLYIKGENAHELSGKELETAPAIHNSFRTKEGSDTLGLGYYTGDSPQRMWGARITNFWVNYTNRGADGHLIKDGRIEITTKDLLNLK